jgi:uncharacterized OB-fold protein
VPTPETQPFWDAALVGVLSIQRCLVCEKPYFYPRPFCPSCHSDQVEWQTMSGRATLYSYVIIYQAVPGCETDVPYVLAVVTLAEGPRLMTNIVGVDPLPKCLPLDLSLRVEFVQQGNWKIPMFAPADLANE